MHAQRNVCVPSIEVTIEPSPPCVMSATTGAADADADAAADADALVPAFCAAALEVLALSLLPFATSTPAMMPPITRRAMIPPQISHVRRFDCRLAAFRRPDNGDDGSVAAPAVAPYLLSASVEPYCECQP